MEGWIKIHRRVFDHPDYIQKIDCFKAETTAEERERVAFVIDDSPTVMFHWRRLGYRTLLIS